MRDFDERVFLFYSRYEQGHNHGFKFSEHYVGRYCAPLLTPHRRNLVYEDKLFVCFEQYEHRKA